MISPRSVNPGSPTAEGRGRCSSRAAPLCQVRRAAPRGGGVPWGHSGSLRGGHPLPGDAGVCGQRRPQGAPEWGWAPGHTQARVRCPRAGIGGSLGQCRGALRGPQEGTHTSTPPGGFHEPPVLTPTLGGSCHHCSILQMQKPRCGEEQRLAQGYLVTK